MRRPRHPPTTPRQSRPWAPIARRVHGGLLATLATLSCPGVAVSQPSARACVPTVIIEGDQALVDSVGAYLNARGIATSSASDCGSLMVRVTAQQGKVHVLVRDATGRDDSRLVTDSATASVFVESRVRSDLAMTLPEPVSRAQEHADLGVTPRQPALDRPRGSATASESEVPVSAGFRPGVSFGSDGSSWLDLGVGGCVKVDPLCPGGMLRGSLDLGISGRSAELSTERGGVDALVSVEVPISVSHSVRLSPGLGIGAGWLRVGPRGSAEGPPSAEVSADFGGLRLEAFARSTWSIAEPWALGVGVYTVVDPLAHTGDIRDPDALLAGNPRVRAGAAVELSYGAP